jgi:hypothetical protein
MTRVAVPKPESVDDPLIKEYPSYTVAAVFQRSSESLRSC